MPIFILLGLLISVVAKPVNHQTPMIIEQGSWGSTISMNPQTKACEQLSAISLVQKHRLLSLKNTIIVERAERVRDHSGQGGDLLVSIYGIHYSYVKEQIEKDCRSVKWYEEEESGFKAQSNTEIIPIISNGDPKNRIDVVFMGDGYTLEQRDMFESDIRRLVQDMWSGSTFESFLPLFNVWGIFVPSKESGIGIGGRPKNTAFGLYRDGTELRGIYTSKARDARNICKLTGAMACDYPSLIGNDPYYGGLGGEFVIATKSDTSGTIVLRHEMGHNFVGVGEEYDGGSVYSGVNAARSLNSLGWKEWLTEPVVREEVAAILIQDYSWYNLAKGEYILRFSSSGTASSWKLQISVSGMEVNGALNIHLDGQQLNWTSAGSLDRTFYEWESQVGLSKGFHELVFEQALPLASPSSPIRQLCSVSMHEYAKDPLFRKDNAFIGAYPTWDINGRKSYRPTNEGCLMRNMLIPSFCPGFIFLISLY
jgi:hypothetical protein